MASQPLLPMAWDLQVCGVCSDWWRQALINDRDFIHNRQCTAVHDYITQKCYHIITTRRSIGQAGWAFYNRRHDPDQCIPCLVWADGRSEVSQCTPLGQPRGDEQWWPCICLNITPDAHGLLPFYCPALAWGNSRPWWVHKSRVRRLVLGANIIYRTTQQAPPLQAPPQEAQAPPQQAPPPQQSPSTTSTATATHNDSESESESSESSESSFIVIDFNEMD